MKGSALIIFIVILIVLCCSWPFKNKGEDRKEDVQRSPFGDDDQSYALAALNDLDNQDFLNNRFTNGVPEVDDYYLTKNAHNIQLIKERQTDARAANGEGPVGLDPNIEGLSFYNHSNTDYWPSYYYSKPEHGGAWPPNMQNRLYNWQPGFASGTGWSYWLRPGITYNRWPRNRWVKQNNKFYFINNGDEQDRSRDFTGEPS
jgi:hypothetical protein